MGPNDGSVPAGYQLIDANGYQFSTKVSGNKQDTSVILLHGFPESSAMWGRLAADLNQSGYHTVAPDQRGYSHLARPLDIGEYHISHLANDVIAIADALGIDQFHLIGHDWGSAVGWQVAADHPDRLFSFTSLSVPHLDALARAYQEDSLQHAASDYVRNFQVAKLPEFILARNDYKLLESLWSEHTEEELAAYTTLFRQKHALTSSINWYRANFDVFGNGNGIGNIKVPVLFVWGNKDSALQRSGVEWTRNYVDGYYRFLELEAGHWLVQGSYDTIWKEIEQHLKNF